MEELVKIEDSISSLYQKMYKLELEHKKETLEYQTLLDYLVIALDVEERKYNDLFTDGNEALDFVVSFDSKKGIGLEEIIKGKTDNKVLIRIYNTLTDSVITNNKSVRKILFEDTEEKYAKLEEMLIKLFTTEMQFQLALNKDGYMLFLALLEIYLNNPDYAEYREDLLKVKYNIIFLNKNIEHSFLDNDFTMPKPDLSSKLYASLVGVSGEGYEKIKNNIYSEIAAYQLASMLFNEKENYEDKKENILRSIWLRSLFLTLDNEVIDVLNESVHDLIESDEYINNDTIRKNEDEVISCFKKIKLDRQKVKVYS